MEEEHTFEEQLDEADRANAMVEEVERLDRSIYRAFTEMDAAQIRAWYVETFVLEDNIATLRGMSRNVVLDALHSNHGWPTTEHKAIGHRLRFEINPDIIPRPNMLDVEAWRTTESVGHFMMRLMRPWESIRFDPEGENWYERVEPGQWRRHGKGAPGQSAIEYRISQWLSTMDHYTGNKDIYAGFYPTDEELSKWSTEPEVPANLMAGSQKAFKKFRGAVTTVPNLRKILEREPIMHLDSSTLNRIRNMTPFANGMLSLKYYTYTDTEGNEHTIYPGELRPMDAEYMVTNANTLKWEDGKRDVVYAIDFAYRHLVGDIGTAEEWNWSAMEELEDDLMALQCPTYWSFLTHAFHDHEERSAFMRLLGAAMYGTNLKIVAAMIGEPNAGKDTVINWLSYLMPNQVAALPFSAFTPHGDEDRGFAPLMGARVATVSGEVGEGRGSKLLAEKIKTVSSGGGTLRVAEKYEKPTTIFFDGMLFLQGNSVPTIAGGDRALYENRLVAVEFKHPFPLSSIPYDKQYRAEAAAFAKVLFLNYFRYEAKGGGMIGINPPDSWKVFAREFADAANPHGFIENAITLSDEPIATHQFHSALSAMAERFGSPYKVGANYWAKRLKALGFPLKGEGSVRKRVGADRTYAYYLTLDAEKSDGAFTQAQWENILADSAVTS